jgi:hypothetical protein
VRLRPQSTPTSVDGTREALRANTARARVRRRSFVRNVVDETTEARRETRDAGEDERAIVR